MNLSCDTLEISRSGYYSWRDRPVSERSSKNIELLAQIRAAFERSDSTYGSPRITRKLRESGCEINEKRVARLMRENCIASEAVKKFRVTTTDSNHDFPIADRIYETENVDAVMAPNQVFVGDITYIEIKEGWLFLAVFIDLFTRKVVGFSADDNMRTALVINALTMALGRQKVNDGETIAHTDRGSQYAASEYRKVLGNAGIVASMSRKGNCWDNAHCESFFHSLKTELVYRRKFESREEAKRAIFRWIEAWYNRERLHSSLGYMNSSKWPAARIRKRR